MLDRLGIALGQANDHSGARLAWADGEVTPHGRSSAQLEADLLGAIDRDDLNILLLGLNTVASASNDPRDLDHDGRITVLDVRKLVASCTRALCGK